jgi:hypothetical protein
MILGRFAEISTSGRFIGHVRTLFFRSDKVVFEPTAAKMRKRQAIASTRPTRSNWARPGEKYRKTA